MEHYYAVIMAGGAGTRLWPLSRKDTPKQTLKLFGERSLFQISAQRLAGLFPPERIFVVTVAEQAPVLKQHCPEIPHENFLIEPMPRGTASVVGLAAITLQKIDPQAVMAVLTSDHFIGDERRFRELLVTARDVALDGFLVTMGIPPTYPATGFGYIQRGGMIGVYHGHEVYKVAQFKEKPIEVQAKRMLESDDYLWNSGMFFWRADRILSEIERQMPDLAANLEEILRVLGTPDQKQVIQRVWSQLKSETIDYGIMENARQVAMLQALGLEWSDIGSWDSLFGLLEGDSDGNIVFGQEHITLDTTQSLVYTNQPGRIIVTIGIDDLIVVDTGDVLLICDRKKAQQVRQVVNMLQQDSPEVI